MAAATISIEARIRDHTVQMMELASRMIADSVRSLDDHDTDLAKSIVALDDEIDRIEVEVESMCVDSFSRALSGKPLRLVAATYKISGELERIGDYAVAVANVMLALANKPLTKSSLEITRMAQIAECMLGACRKSYEGVTPLPIKRVFEDDVKIDQLYNDIFLEVLTSALEEPETITNLIYLTIASRALERIGDHITNIAERHPNADARIVFTITTVRRRSVPANVDAPLKPIQPTSRMNVPRNAIGRW
jgi:phosphate transport system protein